MSAILNYEEGARCPVVGCDGRLEYPEVENCSCHVSSPCPACMDNELTCLVCGWTLADIESKETQ